MITLYNILRSYFHATLVLAMNIHLQPSLLCSYQLLARLQLIKQCSYLFTMLIKNHKYTDFKIRQWALISLCSLDLYITGWKCHFPQIYLLILYSSHVIRCCTYFIIWTCVKLLWISSAPTARQVLSSPMSAVGRKAACEQAGKAVTWKSVPAH